MRASFMLRYINGGQPKPKWRHGLEHRGEWDAEGILTLQTEKVDMLNDYVKVARLHSLTDKSEVAEPLYRAEMLVLPGGRLRVIGMERDIFNKFTAQTWAGRLMETQAPPQDNIAV